MGYDRGASFCFDFEPNEIPFGSKSKGKLSPRSYPIQCERKWKFLPKMYLFIPKIYLGNLFFPKRMILRQCRFNLQDILSTVVGQI